MTWQSIHTAPTDRPILILLYLSLPFVGDVWDCSNRSDIPEDKLIRRRDIGGRIHSYPLNDNYKWTEIPHGWQRG